DQPAERQRDPPDQPADRRGGATGPWHGGRDGRCDAGGGGARSTGAARPDRVGGEDEPLPVEAGGWAARGPGSAARGPPPDDRQGRRRAPARPAPGIPSAPASPAGARAEALAPRPPGSSPPAEPAANRRRRPARRTTRPRGPEGGGAEPAPPRCASSGRWR